MLTDNLMLSQFFYCCRAWRRSFEFGDYRNNTVLHQSNRDSRTHINGTRGTTEAKKNPSASTLVESKTEK